MELNYDDGTLRGSALANYVREAMEIAGFILHTDDVPETFGKDARFVGVEVHNNEATLGVGFNFSR